MVEMFAGGCAGGGRGVPVVADGAGRGDILPGDCIPQLNLYITYYIYIYIYILYIEHTLHKFVFMVIYIGNGITRQVGD